MDAPAKKAMPFDRGQTWSDGSTVTPTAAMCEKIGCLGRRYVTEDTIHRTGQPIELIVLQNESGGDITCPTDIAGNACSRFLRFRNTTALDFPRVIAGYQNADGALSVALDDAYSAGFTIPEHDLFYGLLFGPCYVMAAGVGNLATGGSVVSDGAGKIADHANVPAGEHVVGRLDYLAAYLANTRTIVHMANTLRPVPLAG
jgi:hypothetical protein